MPCNRQGELDAAREELRVSEQARAQQAYYIDELRRELRESSGEAERLRTILAGAAWFKEKERLERPSNSPVPAGREARRGYPPALSGVGPPTHDVKLM